MEFDRDKLPLIEVIIRLKPEKPFNLTYTLCSKLRTEMGDKVSAARFLDHPQFELGRGNEHKPRPGEIFGLHLVHFETGLGVGIQPNAFAVQWVKTVRAQPYPRYEAFVSFLEQARDVAKKVYKKDWPKFSAANMTYENFVQTKASPTGADYKKYFKTDIKPGVLAGNKRVHNLNAAWREENGFDVRVDITGIIKTGDEEQTPNGLLFTNTAGKMFDPAEEWPRSAMDDCRTLLNNYFESWITTTAKTEWGA